MLHHDSVLTLREFGIAEGTFEAEFYIDYARLLNYIILDCAPGYNLLKLMRAGCQEVISTTAYH